MQKLEANRLGLIVFGVSSPDTVKTCVNRPDYFEKLGFQDEIFSKQTILFIGIR